jgi:pseudouridine synthase
VKESRTSKRRRDRPPVGAGSSLKTLDRLLSKAGLGSRADAQEWIQAGRVRVNGKVIRSPSSWVNPQRDRISLDGKPVRKPRLIYLLLNKPTGYVTTRKDPQGRPTVYDLIPEVEHWVFPVGRLDRETSGLLLLTNDTRFAELVTNPAHEVPKTYLVKTAPRLTDEQLEQLRGGILLRDGVTGPSRVNRLRDSGNHTFFEITITEGRNRQVRRMVEALGGKTMKLVRVAIGNLQLAGLAIGEYRALLKKEVDSLVGGELRRTADYASQPDKNRRLQ